MAYLKYAYILMYTKMNGKILYIYMKYMYLCAWLNAHIYTFIWSKHRWLGSLEKCDYYLCIYYEIMLFHCKILARVSNIYNHTVITIIFIQWQGVVQSYLTIHFVEVYLP